MHVHEPAKILVSGTWRDEYIYADGRVEQGEWTPNQIQNGAAMVAAGLFGRVGEIPPHDAPVAFTGISYIAVGSGDVTWDAVAPVQDKADTTLTAEYFRKAIPAADMQFVDVAAPHNPSATPTRAIEITMTFDPAEANGAMREFGLFGGDADGVTDSGQIINWVVHPLINKDATLTINRTIRITFLNP